MTFLFLYSLTIQSLIGPNIDYFSGTSINEESISILPGGRHLNDLADVWMVQVVGLQNGVGGIGLFDPYGISGHGRAPQQLNFFLNDVNISDPARPGTPLFELPYPAWQDINFDSFWRESPGFNWSLRPRKRQLVGLNIGMGAPIGGKHWVPQGVLDRDPATCCGATETRRELSNAEEFFAHTQLNTAKHSFYLLGESINHQHQYPTFVNQDGQQLQDDGRRISLLQQSVFYWAELPWLLTGIWQKDDRSNAGAQFRWPQEYTRPEKNQTLHLQLESSFRIAENYKSSLSLAYSYKETSSSALDSHLITNLSDEWLWLARPTWPEFVQRQKVQVNIQSEKDTSSGTRKFSFRAHQSHINTTPRHKSGIAAETYRDSNNLIQPHAMTLYEQSNRYDNILRTLLVGMEEHLKNQHHQLTFRFGLNHSTTKFSEQNSLNFFSPSLGAHYEKPFSTKHRFFMLLRHNPLEITNQIASFLNSNAPSYNKYRWNDDGDLIPNANERGDILQRGGGPFHDVDPALRRPFEERIVVGARWHRLGPFSFSAAALGRIVHNNFTVRFDETTAQTYTPVTISDPGGDGRGEDRLSDGTQSIEVYERQGGEGNERYILTNAQKFNFYTGTELQLNTETNSFWFLNLSATGYWSIGNAPFGSYPDRNEPGLIHEDSANPNRRINQRGRPDHDRSFGINLITGLEPLEDLTTAMVLRYRDGQPFVRTFVVTGLNQGPESIMPVTRGAARHTFHMGVDLRIKYKLDIAGHKVDLSCDVLNLLGSGTELLEDPRTGDNFRTSLEMVPGRSVFVSMGIN